MEVVVADNDLEWLNVFETEAAAEASAAENLSIFELSPRVNKWRGRRDRAGWMASSEVMIIPYVSKDCSGRPPAAINNQIIISFL